MLRDSSLIPLSHQHHHALFLCVRIERAAQAGDLDAGVWQAEMLRQWREEVCVHFQAEEAVLFPEAARLPQLQELVRELLAEHAELRACFARAEQGELDAAGVQAFARKLSEHIRKEERQLFEGCQQLMPADTLSSLGAALAEALKAAAPPSCSLPHPATRLRPRSRE